MDRHRYDLVHYDKEAGAFIESLFIIKMSLHTKCCSCGDPTAYFSLDFMLPLCSEYCKQKQWERLGRQPDGSPYPSKENKEVE